LISQAQLHSAYAQVHATGCTLLEALVAAGAVEEERLCAFYHERLMVPRVGQHDLARLPSRVVARVPVDMAAEFRVIPMDFDRENNLVLAMADPADTHAVDEIAFYTGTFILRAAAAPSLIAWALHHDHGVETPLLRRAPSPLPVAPAPAPAAAGGNGAAAGVWRASLAFVMARSTSP
jgi:type IV pilus assembly protein PilB